MKKIAIIRRDGLGDLLCVCPTISYIRQKWPQAEITLFVSTKNIDLVPYIPPVEEVVLIQTHRNKYLEVIKVALRYRHKKFDLALSAKTSPMRLINVFLGILGAKQTRAYVDKDWSHVFVNAPTEYQKNLCVRRHQALKMLQLIAPHCEKVSSELFPKIAIPPREEGALRLVLSASTSRDSNRLDVMRYAQIVNRLYAQGHEFHVIILALERDRIRALALASALKCSCTLPFPCPFDDFIRVLAQADLVFCGDGGTAHISAAMGKHAVVLFGNSSCEQWAPMGSYITMLHDPIHVNRIADKEIEKALSDALYQIELNNCFV